MRSLQRAARRTSHLLGNDSGVIRLLRPAYNLLLHLSTAGRGVPLTFNGTETFRVDPWQRRHFPEQKDPAVFAYLRQRVQPGARCANVGAHVGLFTLALAHWSAPDGPVLAFEPNPHSRAILARHLWLNNLSDRVEVLPCAVSDAPGEAPFFADGTEGTSRLGRPNPDLPRPHDPPRLTRLVTLDTLFAQRGFVPDWLLIDVEGYEVKVLAGASETVRARGGRLGLVVEFHPSLWESAGSTLGHLKEWLTAMGRTARPLSGQSDPLTEHGVVALEPSAA